jgi:hypothetical protein
MDLSARFKITADARPTVKISSLRTDSSYPIERADKVQTHFGEAILLTIQESPQSYVKVSLPKRYGVLFTEAYFQAVNDKHVSHSLRYRWTCPATNSYILEIE